MVDKKLSEFDEVSTGDVSFFPVLDDNTKNGKLAATKAMPWTNCITEIPQDIKIEISSNSVILKQGSRVYVPNGVGVFDTKNVAGDRTIDASVFSSKDYFLCSSSTGGSVTLRGIYSTTSGTTPPSGSGVFYNTSTNEINYYNSGTKSTQLSFPLAIINVDNGVPTIKQVFNGFGYIGSTVFVLPGVKGLIPNGRNADGTAKSINVNNTAVRIASISGSGSTGVRLGTSSLATGFLQYDQYTNYNRLTLPDGAIRYYVIAGEVTFSSGVITSIKVKQTFVAADLYDVERMVSDVDSNTMKLTGDQTVGGTKTFTNDPYVTKSGTGGRYYIKNTDLDLTNTSRTNEIGTGIRTYDKNDNIAGDLTFGFATNGRSYAQLQTRNRASGSQVTAVISVNVDNAGNIYTSAPTPTSVTDNTTKITTTQWFNNKVKQVSTLPASPTAGVYYFVTD